MMKKLIFLLIVTLIGFAAQSQEYITNKIMNDTNFDGRADSWYVNNSNFTMITVDGWQYAHSDFTVEIGQVIDIPNPIGRTFRLQFDIESDDYTQCRIWIDEVFSYIQSQPNPQPIGLYHYDFTFVYSQSTIRAIEFRTIVGNSWMKVDNVSLTEVFSVGITEYRPRDDTQRPVYYTLNGRESFEEPNHGFYIKRVGNTSTKYLKP